MPYIFENKTYCGLETLNYVQNVFVTKENSFKNDTLESEL